MKKLLLLLLIPGLVLAKEKPVTKEKTCVQAPKPKQWEQIWRERMESCTTAKEKEYLAKYRHVPTEWMLDPAKATLAASIYEENRKIYLRIKPCLDKYEQKKN